MTTVELSPGRGLTVAELMRGVAAYGLPGSSHELPELPLDDREWDVLLASSCLHRVIGLLWQSIRDGAFVTTDAQRSAAAQAHIDAMGGALRLEATLLDLVASLADGGIDVRVLKGSAVAHLDYPDPGLRPFGDIDLLVRSEQVEAAIAELPALGFKRAFAEPRPGFDRRYGKGASFSSAEGIEVDLHRTFVLGPYGLRIGLDRLWTHASSFQLGIVKVPALGDDERFLHACYSAAISDAAPRLMTLRDVAQMVLSGQVDRRTVRELAAEWRAEAVVARAIEVAWAVLEIADVTALSSWAQRYRPDADEQRDLALYTTPGISYTAQALASVGAIPGWASKARFVLSLGLPRGEFLEATPRGFAARLWKGTRDLADAKSRRTTNRRTATLTASLPAMLGGAVPFPQGLPLVRPTITDVPGLVRRLRDILRSGILTNGPTVRALEQAVAARLDVPHVVAVSSCTSGLMLVLQALDASGPVVMPSFTFSASAHAVVWAGGQPVFADIDPRRLTLDVDEARDALDGAVAMTATHVYGAPAQPELLDAVAANAGVPIVYDAAHALGSARDGRAIGGFGTAEVFSMSPTKVVTAGEGGLVTTRDASLADAIRIGRDYGNPGDYDCLFPGLNARMSELHAAIGLASLDGLDDRIAHRTALAAEFRSMLAGVAGLTFQQLDAADRSTYKDLTILVQETTFGLSADDLARVLQAEGIDTRRYYSPAVHQQKAYAQLPRERPLKETERVAEQVLTVPLWSHMTAAQVGRVASSVVAAHEHAARLRAVLR